MEDKNYTITLSNDDKISYKIEEYRGAFTVKRYNPDIFKKSWNEIGTARSIEDAMLIARSDASSFGRIDQTKLV